MSQICGQSVVVCRWYYNPLPLRGYVMRYIHVWKWSAKVTNVTMDGSLITTYKTICNFILRGCDKILY